MGVFVVSGNEITDAVRLANTQGDGRAYPDSSFGIWEGTTNLIPNGGAETNATGCSNNQASTISRSTTFSKFGAASFKAVCNDNTRVMSVEWFDMAGSRIAVTAGLVYTFSLFCRDGGGYGKSATLTINWFNAGGSSISTTVSTAKAVPSAFAGDGTDRLSVTGTAPVGAVSVRLSWTATATNALNDSYYFDGVQMEQRATATPYVETNGATASRGTPRIQALASLLTSTQAWIAFRLRMGINTAGVGLKSSGEAHLFNWSDGTFGITAYLRGDGNVTFVRDHGTGSNAASLVTGGSWNVGDMCTLIFAWDATHVYISVNGGAFAVIANTPSAFGAMNQIDIGGIGTGREIDGDLKWVTGGKGTLANADATTLNAQGNTDPGLGLLGGTAQTTFTWGADTSVYNSYIDAPTTNDLAGSAVVNAPGVVYNFGGGTQAAGGTQTGSGTVLVKGSGNELATATLTGSGVVYDLGGEPLFADSSMTDGGNLLVHGGTSMVGTSTLAGAGDLIRPSGPRLRGRISRSRAGTARNP